MWNWRCAHGNAFFVHIAPDVGCAPLDRHRERPKRLQVTSSPPPADRAADPDRRSGGLHQANGVDSVAVGSEAVFVRACAFLSLILHQDIKSSGSRWPVSTTTSGRGWTDSPGCHHEEARSAVRVLAGVLFLWFAHLRQRGLDPYTPAKTTWGADAHSGAPDVRTDGTAEAAAHRGLGPRGPGRSGPQRSCGRGWERPHSPRDCCGFGAVRVCAPPAPPPRVAPRPAILAEGSFSAASRRRTTSGGLPVARGMSFGVRGGRPRPEVFVKQKHIWLL